jgi:heterodisulfide reductase subunit A-like polyferredoxin
MILIIGAGISGLFTGYTLSKKGLDFKIVEKSRIGGKIKSGKYDNSIIEYGPSVFHSNQKNIIDLCTELGIELKESSGSFYSFTKLIDLKHIKPRKGYVKDHLTPENCSVYYENEYALFNDFINGVHNEGKYMYPVGGFENIVNKLKTILKNNIIDGKVTSVKEGGYVSLIHNNKRIDLKCSNVICCVTMKQLYKIIKFSIPKDITKTMSSVRVYALFDKNLSDINPVFKNKVIYYPLGGLCIKLSETVLLLCYTDGDNTNRIDIKKCLYFFGLQRNVIEILNIYYNDAYDLITSKIDLPIMIGENIYQTAFPDRHNQAWLEGNLIQCNKVVKKIKKITH